VVDEKMLLRAMRDAGAIAGRLSEKAPILCRVPELYMVAGGFFNL
jgi:hypothetical protein